MGNEQQPRASETAERFVKQLNVAYKAVRLYPPSSAIPRESGAVALLTLQAMLRRDPDVRIQVTKLGLFHEDGLIHPGQEAFDEFAREFFSRRLAEVRFHVGATVDDIIGFLRVLDVPQAEFTTLGGFESRLWEAGVVNVTVREATTRIVDHALDDDTLPPPEEIELDAKTIDQALAEFSAGRPRDQVVIVRLVDTPEALVSYLEESARGRGTTPSATWVTSRVSALASAVSGLDAAERDRRLKALADALMDLDDDILREILGERLLAEARHDESLAEVVRRIGVDRVCEVLAAGLESTNESRQGLTRAFRNLLHFVEVDKEQGFAAIGNALQDCGVDESTADQILAEISPTQITATEPERSDDQSPIERILRIIDMAPGVGGKAAVGVDAEELAREAYLGISDGDVLNSMVTLVVIEQREEQFASLMSIVEDGLTLLVTRQEFQVAADVTDALCLAADDEARPESQRTRLRGALDVLASKPITRSIAAAMRSHDPESGEYRACRHLLSVLGRHAIEPLLEVLADEPDMSARKALVGLISEMAADHMTELGSRLGDGRWYFVRNIVSILGSTRTPQTLTLLGRTLRHPDARVRRETIRAVAAIKDALATQMLAAALDDEDEQIVQLSARYLGLMGTRTAIGALELVATGRGDGNRETPVRVEAIEALGRLASVGSLPTLKALTRPRAIRGRARAREVANAAEVAIKVIERTMPPKEVTP